MTSTISHILTTQENPQCLAQPLPSWLVHDLMQQLNAYGLVSEHINAAIQPLLANDAPLRMAWEVLGNAIETQERLLRNLRLFLNLRPAQEPLEKRAVNLEQLIQQLQERHNAEFPETCLNIQGGEGCHLISHPDRLLELLSSLVENAAIHTKSMVNLVVHATPTSVRIEVVDDGKGIDAEVMGRLGMPFLRHVSHRPTKRRGLGLGIYIAARIAELLDLTIEISSSPNEGSRFSITLPRAVTPSTRTDSPGNLDPIEGSSILIVDSDQQHGRALRDLFVSWNCRSDCQPNWTTTLNERVSSGNYDALLLEQTVWLEHATDILQAIRTETALQPEIFVLLAPQASTSSDFLTEAGTPSAHVLRRPLTPSRIRSALENILRLRQNIA